MMRYANHTQMCRMLELADAVGLEMVERICKAVLEARRKHPEFASCYQEGMHTVESEFYEFKAQAMLAQRPDGTLRHGRVQKSEAELMDLIATGIRMLCREYPYSPLVSITVQATDNFSGPLSDVVRQAVHNRFGKDVV